MVRKGDLFLSSVRNYFFIAILIFILGVLSFGITQYISHFTPPIQASQTTDFINNEAPADTVGIEEENVLVMDITIPDGMNNQGVEDTLITDGAQEYFHGEVLSSFNNMEPNLELFLDHGTVNASYDDGEDIFRQVHDGADVYVSGNTMQAFANRELFYFDDATGTSGDYDETIEALMEDLDFDLAPSAGDAVIKAGQANVRALTTDDNVCFDGSVVDDAEYDEGEIIWLDVAGDCLSFDSGVDNILVGAVAPTNTQTKFGVEKEIGYLDEDESESFTCERETQCEILIYSGQNGVDITTGSSLTLNTEFFDSSQEATDGIFVTGRAWDESAVAAQFEITNSEKLTVANNSTLQTGDILFWADLWVYREPTAGHQALIAKDAGGAMREWGLYLAYGNQVKLFITGSGSDSTQVQLAFPTTLAASTWYHVFAWHDPVADTINIKVNDGVPASMSYTQGVAFTDAPFNIGVLGNTLYFDGRIDAVGFGKSPSASITDIATGRYNAGNGVAYPDMTFAQKTDWGLVSHWDLDEGSGTRFDAHGDNDLSDVNTVTTNTGRMINTVVYEDMAQAASSFGYVGVAPSTPYANGDDIFKLIHNGISAIFADDDVSESFPLNYSYIDDDNDTFFTSGEPIYEDSGDNVGVLDKKEDELRGIGLSNLGTAIDTTDISSVHVWSEEGSTAGFQSNEDTDLGAMSVHSGNDQQWRLSGLSQNIPENGTRLYVTANISVAPTDASTMQFSIPVYNDIGSDNLALSDGDVGVFVASSNDGPVDLAITNTAIQNIDGIQPTFSATTQTIDSDFDGTIDQIQIDFSETITLIDTNEVDGIPSLALTDGCVIDDDDYGFTGNTFIVDVTGCTASDTSITPTLMYTEVADCSTQGSICDDGSNQMENTHAIAVSDEAGPVILLTFPLDGAVDMSAVVEPSILFTESIDTNTFSYTSTNTPGSGYVLEWSDNDTMVTFMHTSRYVASKDFTLEVTIADDMQGNVLAGNLDTHSFTFSSEKKSGYTQVPACVPLTVFNVEINNGNDISTSSEILLNVTQNGAKEIVISQSPDFINSSVISINENEAILTYNLKGSFGPKTLYLFARNNCRVSQIFKSTFQYQSEEKVVNDVIVEINPSTASIEEKIEVQIQIVNEKNIPLTGNKIVLQSQSLDILTIEPREQIGDDQKQSIFRVTSTQTGSYTIDIYVDEEFIKKIKVIFAESESEEQKLEELDISIGDIIQEDGLPSIYYYGPDQKLHLFLNEHIFQSYFESYDMVQKKEVGITAKIPIGEPVMLRSGTWLIKSVLSPKSYIVLSGKRLQWVVTEDIANYLFGSQWTKRIIDMPESYFDYYTFLEPLLFPIFPSGNVIQFEENPFIYYITEGAKKRPFLNGGFLLNQLQEKFISKIIDNDVYKLDAPISEKEAIFDIEY